jgi:hypothetical protein
MFRAVLCLLLLLIASKSLDAQTANPTPGGGGGNNVTGVTACTIGQPTYTWNGNVATVTIEVSHELSSIEHS